MQNRVLKIVGVMLCLLLAGKALYAQSLHGHLRQADSLFHQKKYTQSYDLYQAIFKQGQHSPAMLLKMAYIAEGLHEAAMAMYYLNLYYQATYDNAALTKITELAETHGLSGYERTDAHTAWTVYAKNQMGIALVLTLCIVALSAIMAFKQKRNQKPVGVWIVNSVLLLVLAAHTNVTTPRYAITQHDDTLVMSGPSAGASVAARITAGHKVHVVGERDVWKKVIWNNKEVYIRQTNLLPLNR
jgi:hypothetical protein